MSKYCPNCHQEFSNSFDTCVYCDTSLKSGINPKPIIIEPTKDEIAELQKLKENREKFAYRRNQLNECREYFRQSQNIPECPTCNSTRIHKISSANKVGAVALFGVFSIGHVGKTFKCDSCGYKW